MKQPSYYQTMFRRRNVIMEALLNFFLSLCSWPRMLLEVFLRRNQGERYFSFSGALALAGFMALMPFIFIYGFDLFSSYARSYHRFQWADFLGDYLTWYLYLSAFIYMAIQRRDEIKRLPSVFDFERFSLSTGLIHPRFYYYQHNGNYFSVRTIETILEPGLFFFIGALFWIMGQPIGTVLFISSIFSSLSYVAAYRQGDHYLMDAIDARICQEELSTTFVEGLDAGSGRGFRYYGHKPATKEARQRVADLLTQPSETFEAF